MFLFLKGYFSLLKTVLNISVPAKSWSDAFYQERHGANSYPHGRRERVDAVSIITVEPMRTVMNVLIQGRFRRNLTGSETRVFRERNFVICKSYKLAKLQL